MQYSGLSSEVNFLFFSVPSFNIHSPLLWTRHMEHADGWGMAHMLKELTKRGQERKKISK